MKTTWKFAAKNFQIFRSYSKAVSKLLEKTDTSDTSFHLYLYFGDRPLNFDRVFLKKRSPVETNNAPEFLEMFSWKLLMA